MEGVLETLTSDWRVALAALLVAVVVLPAVIGLLPSLTGAVAGKGGSAIVFTGPEGAGKTTIVHKLWKGHVEKTVLSVKPLDKTVALADLPDHKVHLVDVPGHPRVAGAVRDFLPTARRVVFAVDCAGDAQHMAQAGEMLFDLLTTPAMVERGLRLTLLGCKADAADALTAGELQSALERAVTAVKDTRSSLADTSDGGSGAVLGRRGKAFTFAADCHADVDCFTVSAHSGRGWKQLLASVTEQ